MNVSVKIVSILCCYDILSKISKLYVPKISKIVSSMFIVSVVVLLGLTLCNVFSCQ